MKPKAHAIVLAAGSGTKLTSIVKRLPKCLLPIGNHPMIFYPLHMLHQAGFTEATVVVSTKAESEVKKAVDQLHLDMKVEYLPIQVSEDPGTADTLRLIAGKIKKNAEDVLLISSDIMSNVSLDEMFSQHMSVGAMLTMLTTKMDDFKVVVPGPIVKSTTGIYGLDILVVEQDTNDIKYLIPDGDSDGRLLIPREILATFTKPIHSLTSTDCHLYLLKRWVFDYILSESSPCSSMISIKAEVIPHIIVCQNEIKRDGKVKILDDFIKKGRYEDLICEYNDSTKRGRYNALNPNKKICRTFYHNNTYRINKLETYWMMNKMMISCEDCMSTGIKRRHATADINEKAQVCAQSFIGKKTVVSEKTNVTRSAIGNSCKIQPLARITDSVLFDQVVIQSGAVIEDSIICTPIHRKCTIKKCIVIDAYSLKDDHTYENEIIEASHVFS